MLRSLSRYNAQKFTVDKPVFHWSRLFKSHQRASDIDLVIPYKGHHLYIESKPLGAKVNPTQAAVLESLASVRNNHVLLVGLKTMPQGDLFNQDGVVAAWVWINERDWRDPRNATWGTPDEFIAFLDGWKKKIDCLSQAANEEYFLIAQNAG